MGVHTLLQRRRYSYVIRNRVPADLVSIIGKREIVKSLHTLNVEEANGSACRRRSMHRNVKLAFERRIVEMPLTNLLPLKHVAPAVKLMVKYKRIAALIAQVGVIEPLVVAPPKEPGGQKVLGNICKAVVGHRIDGLDLSVFMKLSALPLS